jgi:hypothetical protein
MWRRIQLIAAAGIFALALLDIFLKVRAISRWAFAIPVGLAILLIKVYAFPFKGRTLTPEQWADELERHLLPNEGAYDWDKATSMTMADEKLERLRCSLVPDFDRLDNPQKIEQLRRIIESLRRGEIPEEPGIPT